MKHKQLIDVLKSYGRISELEEIKIREKFIIKEVGKKEVLVEKNSPCNKFFLSTKDYYEHILLIIWGKILLEHLLGKIDLSLILLVSKILIKITKL